MSVPPIIDSDLERNNTLLHASQAVAADPTLTDREAQGRAIYLRRNGEAALLRMLKSRAKHKDDRMPWSSDD